MINNNYKNASIVIDIANDISYSLVVYPDVKKLMSADSYIFYCFDQNIPYYQESSNSSNTITTDPNFFVTKLIDMIHTSNNLSNNPWPNTKAAQNAYIIELINKLANQTYIDPINPGTKIFTTAAIIANIVNRF